jgi:hypothetical protein
MNKSEIVQPEEPEINVKRPYSQLVPAEEKLNDSISSSHAHLKEDKKNSTGTIYASVIVGGLAGLGVLLYTKKGLIAATVGAFVSVITFSTIRKS